MSSANVVYLNPGRLRSWILRLPFTTRMLVAIISLSGLVSVVVRGLPHFLKLFPAKMSLLSMHRLTTFPFAYTSIIHCLCILVALVPFLERFETEHGSLVTLSLFCGPFSQLPGLLYLLLYHVLIRGDGVLLGAGVWVFILLATESIKTYRLTPAINLGPFSIPTYIYPFFFVVVVFFFSVSSHRNLIANLCGCIIGYGFELGYLKFLIPPEKIVRWVEAKLNLLGRLPHYVSVDQKTYGRYGVLPSVMDPKASAVGSSVRGLSPRAFAAAAGPSRAN